MVDNWTSAMGDEMACGERLRFEVQGAGEVSAILVAGEGSETAGAGTRRGSRDQPYEFAMSQLRQNEILENALRKQV